MFCSLVDVTLPFDIKTTEVFQTSQEEFETEAEIHCLEGEVLDLPVIKENILLEIPMQIFSDDVSGGAPTQGQDWQVISEEDKEKPVDQDWQDLQSFLTNNRKTGSGLHMKITISFKEVGRMAVPFRRTSKTVKKTSYAFKLSIPGMGKLTSCR